jgi:hypothetical protein
MKYLAKGLTLMLLVAISISGAGAITGTVSYNGAGSSQAFDENSGVSSSIIANSEVLYGSSSITNNYLYTDTVSIGGNTAGVRTWVSADTTGPSKTSGTHTWGSDTSGLVATYWQTLTLANARQAHVEAWATSAGGDYAEAEVWGGQFGGDDEVNIDGLWQIAQAGGNYAFAAQGAKMIKAEDDFEVDNFARTNDANTQAHIYWEGISVDTNRIVRLDDYASYALALDDMHTVAMMLGGNGYVEDDGDYIRLNIYSQSPFYTGTWDTRVFVEAEGDDGYIQASPNGDAWPALAYAGPDSAIAMGEAIVGSPTWSQMEALGGAAHAEKQNTGFGAVDYAGVGVTYKDVAGDFAYVNKA